MKKPICGICRKFVRTVKVKNPREPGEVVFVCKEHGDITSYVEFIDY